MTSYLNIVKGVCLKGIRHNEQECRILHSELNQLHVDLDKQESSSLSNDKNKGEESNLQMGHSRGKYG